MAEQDEQPTRFAPVVLAGLASAAAIAAGSARDWFRLGSNTKVGFLVPNDQLRADMPLSLALALVLLAAWGVVLVTGRRTRRFVLALAALANLGVLVCLVVAPFTLPDDIREALGNETAGNGVDPTAAYLITCVVAPLALVAVVLGLRYAPRWPEMSSRYDAPTTAATASDPDAPVDDLSLWKSLDEGHDPTGPSSE